MDVLIGKASTVKLNAPGSTLLTHSSPSLTPFSTFGNVCRASAPPSDSAVRWSFQPYIWSLEPDDPASMTIPNRRDAHHESAAVGGGIDYSMLTAPFTAELYQKHWACSVSLGVIASTNLKIYNMQHKRGICNQKWYVACILFHLSSPTATMFSTQDLPENQASPARFEILPGIQVCLSLVHVFGNL